MTPSKRGSFGPMQPLGSDRLYQIIEPAEDKREREREEETISFVFPRPNVKRFLKKIK